MKKIDVLIGGHRCARIIFISSLLLCINSVEIRSDDTITKVLERADHYSLVTFEWEKAFDELLSILDKYPDNDEVLWRVSRAYSDSGEIYEEYYGTEDRVSLTLYEKSLEYADRAIQVNNENAMAFTYRAIATGRIALYRGIWQAIDLVKQTRGAVETAVKLDPENDLAHYIMARTHDEVSERPKLFRLPLGLGWANIDDAIYHYEKALELFSTSVLYHLDTARAYVRKKEYDRARELLKKVPDLPTTNQLDDRYRREAEELLEKLGT